MLLFGMNVFPPDAAPHGIRGMSIDPAAQVLVQTGLRAQIRTDSGKESPTRNHGGNNRNFSIGLNRFRKL